MIAATAKAPTVQQIIIAEAGAMMKDVIGFLSLSLFITAVLIWAY